MINKKLFTLLLLVGVSPVLKASNYYINNNEGNDSNKGTSKITCWKTIAPLENVQLQPGDSVLFATGQSFTGMLRLVGLRAMLEHPIVIGHYQYKSSKAKPILDAGKEAYAILVQNSSFIKINGIEVKASSLYPSNSFEKPAEMRCGILVEITNDDIFESIELSDMVVHDIYYNPPGFVRPAAEIRTANGTQRYGWGIRVMNNTKTGLLKDVKVLRCEVFNVSHTGVKVTAHEKGIQQVEVAHCNVYQTGGPGMQFSGVDGGHFHHNKIQYSGSTADSRNWGRGSGLWTWSCSNILIEHNRFENANGPGDSAGVHIDYNCSDVVIQYNLSANNAGGFCEILGNNYNCGYRYNISVNDGARVKGMDGAFQEGKIFWLSGYQGDQKKNAGPYNSYFYNNTIYVRAKQVPKIAVSSSAEGVLIANNIFYFESASQAVAGDQKRKEVDVDGVPNVVFTNNLFLRADNWPTDLLLQDTAAMIGDPGFKNKGGLVLMDYAPGNRNLVLNKGAAILPLPNDSIGLRIGLKVERDILGNKIVGKPGLGAIQWLVN